MSDNTTLSRRLLLASISAAAMTPAAAANTAHAPNFATDDPAIAAIEQHRLALQAWHASMGGKTEDEDKISQQLLNAEREAWRAWLTTPPTTLAGVIATLEHASRKPYTSDYPDDYVYTNLAETAEYLGDSREMGAQFPQMIADALRRVLREAADRTAA
jgi:predicted TPR repeat methyltransferase